MVFLLFFTESPPQQLQLLVSHNQQLWPSIPPTAFFSINRTPILPRRIHTKSRRWDSNAETFRTHNFDFNSSTDEDFEDDDDSIQWLDILEDFIDVQVFRSFGWLLPAIISSFLLTSGPKAFLMALGIPLGQSLLSFVFQTVWGRPKNRTKSRGKSKRRPPRPPPPRRSASSMDIDDEQEDEYMRGERKRAATGYQTWVAGDGSSDEKTNGSSSSSFGGWEELDRRAGSKSNTDRKRKTSKTTLSRREKRSQTPLLLRLLIAVFPFLGSWTRLL